MQRTTTLQQQVHLGTGSMRPAQVMLQLKPEGLGTLGGRRRGEGRGEEQGERKAHAQSYTGRKASMAA